MFKIGQIVMTRGICDLVEKDEFFANFVMRCLERHCQGDWGNVCEDDKRENDFAVDRNLRILSAYNYNSQVEIWIITEADRFITTVLFPDDY